MERSYDHYKIRDQLGAGKLGRVYLAEDTRTGQEVAFKILYEEALGGRRDMKRFKREAKTVGGIHHPNIGDVYDVGKTESSCYVVSEFFRGETLRERIDKGQIDIREALNIAIQVASALKETHRARIVHRDIKPENIMLLSGGRVKVTDFGLAKLTGRSIKRGGYKPLIGAEGKLVRSISYMSPEQVRGFAIDRRSDIWGLGALLYEMVSGQPPFDATTTTNVMYSILKGEPRPLTRVPKDLERIVTKALTKSRWHRYQTAKDMAADLEHLRDNLKLGKGQVVINQGTHVGNYESSESFMQRIRRRIAGTNRGYGIRVPQETQFGDIAADAPGTDAEPYRSDPEPQVDTYKTLEDAVAWASDEQHAADVSADDVMAYSPQEPSVEPADQGLETSKTEPDPKSLYINLWIQDKQRIVLSLPAVLTSGEVYEFVFAIESWAREAGGIAKRFPEPPQLRESPTTQVLIEVLCSFLETEDQRGYVLRTVDYHAGMGVPPETFTLCPREEGKFILTARLIVKGEILYREVLPLEVIGESAARLSQEAAQVAAQGA
ncbi:MAG TPA: serine/threonine-protein kinase [Pyrinomonadaceae bacterium]|nr:serine/threonine-protein kinase [Pyrinomonadaceae bacterium]